MKKADGLRERFKDEPVFKEVIEAIFDMDQGAELRDKRRARHRASQYAIEEGKLWRIRGGTATRARARVECVTKAEALELAIQAHTEGGHWGRDAIKIALLDRICSPKLDANPLPSRTYHETPSIRVTGGRLPIIAERDEWVQHGRRLP